jgi:hypothetical protein
MPKPSSVHRALCARLSREAAAGARAASALPEQRVRSGGRLGAAWRSGRRGTGWLSLSACSRESAVTSLGQMQVLTMHRGA